MAHAPIRSKRKPRTIPESEKAEGIDKAPAPRVAEHKLNMLPLIEPDRIYFDKSIFQGFRKVLRIEEKKGVSGMSDSVIVEANKASGV